MTTTIIPSGAILNCFMPKRKFNVKRSIMNIQAKLMKKKQGFEVLLNHTATIEKTPENILIWEATAGRGVAPTELSLYSKDAVFYITLTHKWNAGKSLEALERLKAQAGKKYDFKSWSIYARYLFSGKWVGKTTFAEYSKKWYCSELIDHSHEITETPWMSSPNNIYAATKKNEIWFGTYSDLITGLYSGKLKIT